MPGSDRPLDHLDVTIAPLLNALVQIDEALAQLHVLGVATIQVDEDLLHVRRRFDRCRHLPIEMRLWNGIMLAREIAQKRIPQRRLAMPALERGPRAAALRETPDRLLRLHTEQKLDLPELVRLITAGRIEPLAKAQELERRHRFQDIELRDHDLQDRQDALQRVLRTMRFVLFE